MILHKTGIDGLLIIEPDIFADDRGFFLESYNKNKYEQIGINIDFVQDNISKSEKNTIRGLHYQVKPNEQGKLCQVLLGRVLDVAVDIRFGSPSFGRYFSCELSGENKNQLWIPPGFAHGFSVLSESAVFHYKCTGFYSKKDERTILFNDKFLSIDWKIENPIISNKDKEGIVFKNIEQDFSFSKNNSI